MVAVTDKIITIAMEMATPSIQPFSHPSVETPIIRETKAAAIKILKMGSSNWSTTNYHMVTYSLTTGSLVP